MDSNQKEFHSHFQTKENGIESGGLYNLVKPAEIAEDVFSNISHIYNHIINSGNRYISTILEKPRYKNNNIKIYLNFIDLDRFNAYAAKSSNIPNQYFIGINIGLLKKVFYLFTKILLNTPNLFEFKIENVKFNKSDFQDIIRQDTRQMPLFLLPNQNKYPMKHQVSLICSLMSIDYIILHELAHIFHGHVDRILSTQKGILGLDEAKEIQIKELSTNEIQCMELDADNAGVWWCANSFAGNNTPVLPKNVYSGLTDTDYFRYLTFSISTVIHCFKGYNYGLNLFEDESHPHPELRFNYMYNALLTFAEINSVNGEIKEDIVENGIKKGVMDFIKLGNVHLDSIAFPVSLNPSNMNVKEIKHTSIKMYEILEEYRNTWKKFKMNPD